MFILINHNLLNTCRRMREAHVEFFRRWNLRSIDGKVPHSTTQVWINPETFPNKCLVTM